MLIHDAARPFPSRDLIARAVAAAEAHGAAAPGVKLADTIKQVDADGKVLATPPRATLRAVQTPQAFRFPLILEAHRRAAAAGVGDLTDDVAVAEWAGAPAFVFEGDPQNFKVTTMSDFAAAETRLAGQATETRVGQGFDVHAFAPGDHVWLCGLRLPHTHALAGHSDADVGPARARRRGLRGACRGRHRRAFPALGPAVERRAVPRLPRPRRRARAGARRRHRASRRHAVCEAPKVGPHREAMRARVAEIAGLDVARVSVKATTTERLGFTGRREGIACLATATVRLP